MSTHFRPRPTSSAPGSPARPTTAHSTIRTVPPSPPDSRDGSCKPPVTFPGELPQIKGAQTPPQEEIATFAEYDLHKDEQVIGKTFVAKHQVTAAPKGNGSALVRRSPVKSRSKSPRKQPITTPVKAPSNQEALEKQQAAGHPNISTDDDITRCPDTPTPLSRKQKRQAYLPLGMRTKYQPKASQSHTHHDKDPQNKKAQNAYSKKTTQHSAPPQTKHYHQDMAGKRTTPSTPPDQRISVSGHSNDTGGSAKSRHSVFSTPGRDELERKKAMVEPDQGPFGRVISMQDLDRERRRISGATVKSEKDAEKSEKRVCGLGCTVM